MKIAERARWRVQEQSSEWRTNDKLTDSHITCPPERLLSTFNATYHDDQRYSYIDYIELSMQSQYVKRIVPMT